MFDDNGLEMDFSVQELKEVLLKNRENHLKIYNEAREGYNKALVKELSSKLKKARKNEKVEANSNLQVPRNNLKEYDTVLEMLSRTSSSGVRLNQQQFNNYVLDKWSWQDSFLATSSLYSAVGAARYNQNQEE